MALLASVLVLVELYLIMSCKSESVIVNPVSQLAAVFRKVNSDSAHLLLQERSLILSDDCRVHLPIFLQLPLLRLIFMIHWLPSV